MALQSSGRPDVVQVTTARLSHTDDLALRQRRYMYTQGVRVLCVVLGVALPVPVPFRLGMFVLAVVLPWFGVVAANAGPTVSRSRPTALVDGHLTETLPEQPVRLAIEPGRVVEGERAGPVEGFPGHPGVTSRRMGR